MNSDLQKLENQLREAKGENLRKLYIHYCVKLIGLVEKGGIREEEAAYDMVEAVPMGFDKLPEFKAIFDAAADAEMFRESSYAQPVGGWDQKTADLLKQREWKKLVLVVENAKNSLKID